MRDHAGPEPATDPVEMPPNLPCGSTVAAPECGDIGDDEDRHQPAVLGAGPTRRVLRLVAAQREGQPWPRTGLAELDRLTGGLAPGTLTVIASRPAMGRSTLLTDVCRHVALQQRRPVWLCSLEERDEVTTRVPAAESSVPLRHLHSGSTTEREEQRLARAVVDIDAAPLRVSAPVALTLRELAVQARRLHGEQALRLLAVDGPDELLLAAGRPPSRRGRRGPAGTPPTGAGVADPGRGDGCSRSVAGARPPPGADRPPGIRRGVAHCRSGAPAAPGGRLPAADAARR
ncbi:hypothetical protein HCN52_03870 [Streptomyces bohaiensis]|uniref:SF4 helicase domain-containing protein n=1 Tax=Streptomyces bohaiensis TaxID=1431344 RepID=A0ABX1C829_9ACTN|nr:hypothetical protein [Streptomyces bohaiensis]